MVRTLALVIALCLSACSGTPSTSAPPAPDPGEADPVRLDSSCLFAAVNVVVEFPDGSAEPLYGSQNIEVLRDGLEGARERARSPEARFVTMGYASRCEPDAVRLSEARAEAMAELLVEGGASRDDILATLGWGNGAASCERCAPADPNGPDIVDALQLHPGCHDRRDWSAMLAVEVCPPVEDPDATLDLEGLRRAAEGARERSSSAPAPSP